MVRLTGQTPKGLRDPREHPTLSPSPGCSERKNVCVADAVRRQRTFFYVRHVGRIAPLVAALVLTSRLEERLGKRREPRRSLAGEGRTRAPGRRAAVVSLPVLLLGGLHLNDLAAPPAASASNPTPTIAPDTLPYPRPIRDPAAAPERRFFLLKPEFWEPIRQQAHRLREPETPILRYVIREPDSGILRYVLRYAISPEMASQIHELSMAEGVDPELAFRVIRVESRFYPRARSPVGALGLMQLMPSTARWLDPSLRTEAQILEPRTNLRLGLRYLRMLLEQYGDVRLALLAYNRGEGAVNRDLRRGADPENGYSREVLGGSVRYRGPGLLPPAVADN